MRKLILSVAFMLAALQAGAQRNTGYYEDYVQYLPWAMYACLSLAGNDNPHDLADILIPAAVSAAVESAAVNSLKFLIPEERPNGTSRNSFPSGHTATAFTAAELVRLEKGWGWGAAAYSVACLVAYSRVYHQCHWWWDAAAGAAIGILSANLGYRSVRPIKKAFGLDLPLETSLAFLPDINPYSRTVGASFSILF